MAKQAFPDPVRNEFDVLFDLCRAQGFKLGVVHHHESQTLAVVVRGATKDEMVSDRVDSTLLPAESVRLLGQIEAAAA